MSGPTDLPQLDELLDLLATIASCHQLTNRLGEELLLVPEEVMAQVRRVLNTPEVDES